MVVKINGQVVAPAVSTIEQKEGGGFQKALMSAGAAFVMLLQDTRAFAAGDEVNWGNGEFMNWLQEKAFYAGVACLVVGVPLLFIKKRWGVKLLSITGGTVGAAFFGPVLFLLLMIGCYYLRQYLGGVLEVVKAGGGGL